MLVNRGDGDGGGGMLLSQQLQCLLTAPGKLEGRNRIHLRNFVEVSVHRKNPACSGDDDRAKLGELA